MLSFVLIQRAKTALQIYKNHTELNKTKTEELTANDSG